MFVGHGMLITAGSGAAAQDPNDLLVGGVPLCVAWWTADLEIGAVGVNATPDPDQCNLVDDLSVTDADGTRRNGHLVQATPGKQPVYADGELQIAGQTVPHNPAGRIAYFESSHADVLALAECASGYPSFGMFGVAVAVGTYACVGHLGSFGGTRDQPFYVIGGEARSYRNAPIEELTYGTVGAVTETLFSFCVISYGATRSLWINGAYVGAVTLGSTTLVPSYQSEFCGRDFGAADYVAMPELVLFANPAGVLTYEMLAAQAGCRARAAVWGATA